MYRHHHIVWMSTPDTGANKTPVIFVSEGGGDVLFEAYAYLCDSDQTGMSTSWQQKAAGDIGRLYEFYRITNASTDTQAQANNFVHAFLRASKHGTIREDGSDPLELRWVGMTNTRFANLKKNLRRFFNFLEDHLEGNFLSASKFAKHSASAVAFERTRKNSLLYHLSDRGVSNRRKGFAAHSLSQEGSANSFPRSHLETLIFQGCKLTRKKRAFGSRIANEYNINLLMSLCLLVGGGLRESELFHIWLDDVRPFEKGGKVYLYHPSDGVVSGYGRTAVRRRQYLLEQYGRLPRNELGATNHELAGWKELLVDDEKLQRTEVYFIDPKWRQLFMSLFLEYRDSVRPSEVRHPYLFVSLSDNEFGQPWKIHSFQDAWKAALKRIGMKPDAAQGINPHGLRHAYGQALVDMDVPPRIIQYAMHHKSPLSQRVYTRPSADTVNKKLTEARSRFLAEESHPSLTGVNAMDLMLMNKKDPAGLLSAWATDLKNE